MAKGASTKRKIKRGIIVSIWNETMRKLDFFTSSKRGGYILCNPFTGQHMQQGPGIPYKSIIKMMKQ